MRFVFFLLLLVTSFNFKAQSYNKIKKDFIEARDKGNSEVYGAKSDELYKFHLQELKKDPVIFAEVENHRASEFFNNKDLESAAKCYEHAVDLIKTHQNDTCFDYGYYAGNLATVYGELGYFELSEKLFYSALPILARYLGASSLEYTLFYKAYVEMIVDKGDYNTAGPLIEALKYYFKTMYGETNSYYLNCLNSEARLLQFKGDYSSSVKKFNEILDLFQKAGNTDSISYASILNNMAESYRNMGEYSEAEKYYLKMMAIQSRQKNYSDWEDVTALNNLGLLYKATGNYVASENSFLAAIAIYKKYNKLENYEASNVYNNLGDLYRITGRVPLAIEYLTKSLKIREQTTGASHENYANVLVNLALLMHQTNQENEAIVLLEQAREIYAVRLGKKHAFYANVINNLGSHYLAKRQYEKALQYKREAMQIYESTNNKNDRYAMCLGSVGTIYTELKKIDSALVYLDKAANKFNEMFGEQDWNYLEIQMNKAYLHYLQRDFKKCLDLYFKSLNHLRSLTYKMLPGMGEDEKLMFYYMVNYRFLDAEAIMCEIALQDKSGKITEPYRASLLENIMNIQSLLVDESKSVQNNIRNSKSPELNKLYLNWQEQLKYIMQLYRADRKELNASNISIPDEENKALLMEKELNQKLSQSKQLVRKAETTYDQLLSRLKKDEALVQIFRTNRKLNDTASEALYGALIVNGENKFPTLIVFQNSAEFETIHFENYYQSILDKKTDHASYEVFWKPIANHLKNAKKVFYSAEGIFRKINPCTLLDKESGLYNLDKYDWSILCGTRDIFNDTTQLPIQKYAVLLGDPVFDDEGENTLKDTPMLTSRLGFEELNPLPGTKEEVNEIEQRLIADNWKVDLFIGKNAKEENIKKINSPAVLHLATHGFFLPDTDYGEEKLIGMDADKVRANPLLRSGILLNGAAAIARKNKIEDGEEDGVLNAAEASLLNLQNTNLVVLSACETGLGEELANGQGIYGLQRSLLVAGAQNVMMSLWPVDDMATKELMISFYSKFINNHSPRISWQMAMKELKQKFNSPYYWGPFILMGN